jgi:hypothetical protein
VKRVLATGLPLTVVAASIVACRALVGITDLTVDAGQFPDGAADAAADTPTLDSPADSSGTGEGAPDVLVDAGLDSSDAADVNCDYEPPFDASGSRIGCLQGCIQGHEVAAGDFFIGDGTQKDCVCTACPVACQSFCASACNTAFLASCDDCATHALVDEAGTCHKVEDTTCTSGCGNLATCLGSCPAQ